MISFFQYYTLLLITAIKTFKCSNREMNTLRNKHTSGRESLAYEAPLHTLHTNSTIQIYEFHTSLLDATFKHMRGKMFYNNVLCFIYSRSHIVFFLLLYNIQSPEIFSPMSIFCSKHHTVHIFLTLHPQTCMHLLRLKCVIVKLCF